jgi:hypothetical protein
MPGVIVSGNRVTISWSAVSGATEFDFGIRDTTTNQFIVDTQTSGRSYTVPIERGKTYRWNVRACNAAGCSAFTSPLFFQTEGAANQVVGQRGITQIERRADDRECVIYARSRVASLPFGLFSMADKRNIINQSTPSAGSIAIIETPGGSFAEIGHVAYVEEVTSNSIIISETNFSSRNYTLRKAVGTKLADAEAQLRIIGYFRP